MMRDTAPASVRLLANGAMVLWMWGVITSALCGSLVLTLILLPVSPADLESPQTFRARVDLRPLLETFLALPIGILLHELTHLFAFRALGYQAFFDEFLLLLRIPLSVHVPGPIRREHYILGLCAPAAVAFPIFAAGWIALLLARALPSPLRLLVLAAAISFAAACDDIGRSFALLRRPHWTLLEDAPSHPSCRPVGSPTWWTADPTARPTHPLRRIGIGLLFHSTAFALSVLLTLLITGIAYWILH